MNLLAKFCLMVLGLLAMSERKKERGEEKPRTLH